MGILNQVLSALGSAAGASATIAVILELVMRVIPSQKPLSILHVVGAVIKKVGAICVAAGDLLDRVLPQNIKE